MKILSFYLLLVFCFGSGPVSANLYSVRMSLDQAASRLGQGSGKKILGARTEQVNGREVHVIKVLTPDGRVQEIRIDAESGQTLSTF